MPKSKEEISQYLATIPGVLNEYNSNQWSYENLDSNVYFSFEFSEPEDDEEEDVSFRDFVSTGFSFNLNYMRPDFFGMEAFTVVEQLIKRLDLYVFNPQNGTPI